MIKVDNERFSRMILQIETIYSVLTGSHFCISVFSSASSQSRLFIGEKQKPNKIQGKKCTSKLEIDLHVIDWKEYLIHYNADLIVAPTGWL